MHQYKYDNITISGLPGAGSSTLAKLTADKLGWEYYGGGDFMRAYAIKIGVFDEKTGFHHDATVYDDEFDRQVDYGVRQKVEEAQGNVLDAWLSGFMTLGKPKVLKVLVYCSDDAVRIDRIVNRDKVNVEQAKKHVFEREQKNLTKWQRMYAKEWQEWVVDSGVLPPEAEIDFWNQKLYDVAIDTFRYSKEETLDKVMEALEGTTESA